jgi:hypothetical protein
MRPLMPGEATRMFKALIRMFARCVPVKELLLDAMED